MLDWQNVTKEELAALYTSRTSEEIGALYGRGSEAVRQKLIAFGIDRRSRKEWGYRFQPPRDELYELYQTKSMKQISEHYGVGETVVWKRLHEYGIKLEGWEDGGHRRKTGREFTPEHRDNLAKAHVGQHAGAKNPNWRDGAAMENMRLRQSLAYRRWKVASLERAGYQCQECGIKHETPCECCGTSITLHVHHVHSFSRYPEIRFDPENSEVLCPKCHHSRHRRKHRVNSVEPRPRNGEGNAEPSRSGL